VRLEGDAALVRYNKEFDGADLTQLRVTDKEIALAAGRVPAELKRAIGVAYANIAKFHAEQAESSRSIETMPGVHCFRKNVAVERVGLYIPGGTAPLFSSVLMLAIPARLAGCREIVMCTPPGQDGRIRDAVLYVAALCGVTEIFKIGGAQAIAAMAYGTESIRSVDKIFGPGNQYVTCAKQIVSTDIAIDMPAGPSEVAVLAGDTCNSRFVAADLLSQAEHGPDSQILLISTSEMVINETLAELEQQLTLLPRRDIAVKSLRNSIAILTETTVEAIAIVNAYAPEHLIIAGLDPDPVLGSVTSAGSVFLGDYSCESAGDYASGTNHTLPTAGFARSTSGISLDSFLKKITVQHITADGLRNLGPTIEIMASAEGLEGHRRAVSVRLEEINGV